ARTAATSRSLPPPASSDRAMDVSEKADRLQSRVQDLDAEPANVPAERLQTTFAILLRSPVSPLQPGC
ncbi:MAG: hypothetical protein HC865_25635, partial [Cyanobacteria bacterium RU_5_0]|nr:hypothetical protein [Cyanobacteria bacterium RU_5_0]